MQKMKKNVVFRILILSSLLVCMLSSLSVAFVNAASEVELYYDDGEAEDGWSWNAAGNLFAVRFTPTTSGQLVECSFYIMLDPATIKVHVLDKNKQDMITSFSATPTSTGWFHVDLSTYEITVSPDADFYVAMEATATNAPYLGTDWNDPDGRSWMEYEGDWYRYDDFLQEEGDLMIRAVIEPSVYLTVNSPYGTPGGEGWYNPDTNVYATLDTDVVDHGNGTRRVFTHWSGDASGTNYAQSNPITMDEEKTAIANWKTQYYLTISTDSGTVTPVSGWYDAVSTVQIDASAPASVVDGERYVWSGWSGTGSGSYSGTDKPATITMNGPITETATWGHEYRLIMDSNFGTTDPSAGENWYDAGSTVQISATAPTATSGEQYSWSGWSGTGSGSYSGTDKPATITMNGPITQTAEWKQEYYLTVTSSYGTYTPESCWVEAGESITASVTSPVSGPSSNTRYSCSGWTGTGSVSTSGNATSTTFTINEPSSITWNWNTQYYLTISTNFGTVTPVSGWYDAGSTVQIRATAPTPTSDEQYIWSGWSGTGSGSYSGTDKPATITMNGPITQTAEWEKKLPEPTVIEINLSSEKITVDNDLTVSGDITPPHETIITLTYKRPDGSMINKTVTSSADGEFSHTYTLNAEGLWSVMASCPEDADYYGSKSETEEFRVEPKESIWPMLEVIIAAVALVVSVIIVGMAWFSSRRKRDHVKELIDQIDDAFFHFKRNSRRCEAELYRLKDIVLEEYKNGTINEANYTILDERIDEYISKLSKP
jgi:hypothetical protein